MSHDLFDHYLKPQAATDSVAENIAEARKDLLAALVKLEGAVVPEDVPAVTKVMDQFGDFAARVSLIGQVKAGKTALANALLNTSELLPSDVNPWTSVVTSIHINRNSPKGKAAIFKFFDESDWDDMVSNSGRIVNLAKKANLDSRVEELTEQIKTLKERTEGRLGRNFKLLLGNQHSFSTYNSDLIKRYVCLGDDAMDEDREGRFADLTKTADLYYETDCFGYPVTLADTPGVNDPFLVREAATLDNLRHSHICVVTLSAHQALSSVDLGLLRVLKRLRSNRLVLFVNRIDELPKPQEQIQEINDFILDVLDKQKLDGDIPVVFGSAAWADAAISGDYENLTEDSVESLASLIEARKEGEATDDPSNLNGLHDVSGISALRTAINRKVWSEIYKPKIESDASRARRIAERSLVFLKEANKGPDFEPDMAGIEQALRDLDTGKDALKNTIEAYAEDAKEKVKMGMGGVYYKFTSAEKKKLRTLLDSRKGVKDWTPDTETLRSELNEVFVEYTEATAKKLELIRRKTSSTVLEAYQTALGSNEGIKISPQPISEPPIPVSLMRTMNIDLRASNSFEWLKRKFNKSIYLDEFDAIAKEDLRSTVEETCEQNIEEYLDSILMDFSHFFDSHTTTIKSLKGISGSDAAAKLEDVQGGGDIPTRINSLRNAFGVLQELETDGDDAATSKARA